MSYFLLHQNGQGKHERSRFPVSGDRIATILRELENENRIFDQTFIEGLNGVLKTRDIIIMLIQKSILDAMSSAFLRIAGVFSKLELQTNRARMKSRMENAEARGKMTGWWGTIKEDIPSTFLKHCAIFMEGKMNVSELTRECGLTRPTVNEYLKMMG